MFHHSVGSLPLGEWMWQMKKAGKPMHLPVRFEVEALILKMICPKPEDRLSIQQVCNQLKVISGKQYKLAIR